MAWTISRTKTVFGDKAVSILDITTDSAEANISTGLAKIDGFSTGIQSLTTSAFAMFPNVDSSGTASGGIIGASGLTSGDEFCIIAYGTR